MPGGGHDRVSRRPIRTKFLPRRETGYTLQGIAAEEMTTMKVKALIAALAVAAGFAPATAFAQCNHDQQASMSCPSGQTWDAASEKCVVAQS